MFSNQPTRRGIPKGFIVRLVIIQMAVAFLIANARSLFEFHPSQTRREAHLEKDAATAEALEQLKRQLTNLQDKHSQDANGKLKKAERELTQAKIKLVSIKVLEKELKKAKAKLTELEAAKTATEEKLEKKQASAEDVKSTEDVKSEANSAVKATTRKKKKDKHIKPALKLASTLKKKDPTIVVGFPKSGTTSVWQYFSCSGVKTLHYCKNSTVDHPPCPHGGIGNCILDNLIAKKPLFEGCADESFEVLAQIDVERPLQRVEGEGGKRGVLLDDGSHSMTDRNRVFLPQQFNLEEIHKDYPTSTFILPLRPPEAWATSTMKWFQMRIHFFNEYMLTQNMTQELGWSPGWPKTPEQKMQYLIDIYEHHTKTVRDFVKKYPSHKLVEVEIADKKAGQIMEDAFGHPASCWGHANAFGNRTLSNAAKEVLLMKEEK